jgi:hypothetical protein
MRLTAINDSLRPRYYDVFAKALYDLPGGGRVAAHVLLAGDRLSYTESNAAVRSRYGTDYAWLTWEGRVGRALRQRTVASYGRLDWRRQGNITEEANLQSAFVDDDRSYGVATLRQDWSAELSPRALLKWGVDAKRERADYDYDSHARRERIEGTPPRVVVRDEVVSALAAPAGTRLGVYVAQRLRPVPSLTAEAGLRYDRASRTGDAIASPRLNLAWEPRPGTAVRGAWGRYSQSQALFRLQAQYGDTAFQPARRAEHRVLGVEQLLPGGLTARAEAYERRLTRQPAGYVNVGPGIDIFPELSWDRVLVEPTSGHARGVELYLAREAGRRVDWSASYVLAEAADRIGGREVPRAIDQRHAVQASWSVHPVSNRWRLSVAGFWHSGWPYTPQVVRLDTLVDTPTQLSTFATWLPGAIYSERVPSYQRLDARFTRYFDTGRGRVSLFAEVYNLLNTANVRGYYTNLDRSSRQFVTRSNARAQLPRLPTAGVTWEF